MKKYKIEVDCPNCANSMVQELNKIEGIKNCEINFMFKEISVEFEDGVDEKEVMKRAAKAVKEYDDEMEIYVD